VATERKSLARRAKDILFLHGTILVYTGTTVLAKVASGHPFLSAGYVLAFVGMFAVLGLYALLWQQVIKRFSPSVAYSNKSVTTIWALVFSAALFGEGITLNNIAGALLIIAGVVLVAQDE
jgi:drug/metabolite transporter (DMT)-like permease